MRHIQKIFILGLFLVQLGFVAGARAQQANDPLTTEPPPLDMRTVPEKYLTEAMAFNDRCAADRNMTQYYDCQCLSLAYLKKRVTEGPIPPGSSISLSVLGECRDATQAAGTIYNACLNRAASFQPGTDPEIYCTCVANSYVRLMDGLRPPINSRTMVRYQTQAMVSCNDPALARKLYHYVPQE
ncbi:MAG: hypothetical protein IT559_00135 [Alphaproteobacteria bacterium]|nr:hypothetical protein [Alphaproteobacteria bacterium]